MERELKTYVWGSIEMKWFSLTQITPSCYSEKGEEKVW